MMSDFVELVRKSGLIGDDQLRAALTQFGNQPQTPLELARYLMRSSLLTKWQCQQLLDGRYRGFVLGKYKLLDQLGRGGMSMVFVAEHMGMQRKVALKMLPKSRTQVGSFVERFRREARASAALNHPNIVRAYDFDCQDDIYYLVMELVEGENLRELVAHEHPLPVPRVARLLTEAAQGLQYAHECGFVHRDIKPANILIDTADKAKILDLGLAMWADSDQSSVTLANDERMLGTADYLAPEQALNSHDVDSRADIYALGGTLFYTLTGQPPYPHGSIAQKIAQHQSATPPDPRTRRADCPPELARLCLLMLQKAPEARIQSAGEVAERLRASLDLGRQGEQAANETDFDWSRLGVNETIQDTAVVRPRSRAAGKRRRRNQIPWWMWVSMAGLLLAAAWLWQLMQRIP